jgi:thiamine-phosphate pyrophosphorylase
LLTTKACRIAISPDKGPLFYYITDRRQLTGISIISCIRRALDWGVDFIQIREKDLHDRELFELTRRVVDLIRGTECGVLVNGRADIALAAGAHGVHLPSTGLNISDIRPWLPKEFCIGVSVHTMREIRIACDQNADYLLLGHVFPTASKQGYGPCLGLKYLKKACLNSSAPILALGGMRPESISSVLRNGAGGVAGISLFQKNDEFNRLKKLIAPKARRPSGKKNPAVG